MQTIYIVCIFNIVCIFKHTIESIIWYMITVSCPKKMFYDTLLEIMLFYNWQHHLKISHSHIVITNLLFFCHPMALPVQEQQTWRDGKPSKIHGCIKLNQMMDGSSLRFPKKPSKFQFLATLFYWVFEKSIPNKSSFSSFQRSAVNKKNAKIFSAPCSQDDLRWAIQMSKWNKSQITSPNCSWFNPEFGTNFPNSLQPSPKKKTNNNYISKSWIFPKSLVKKLSDSWAKPKPRVPVTQLLSTPPSHRRDPQGRRGAQLHMINSYCISWLKQHGTTKKNLEEIFPKLPPKKKKRPFLLPWIFGWKPKFGTFTPLTFWGKGWTRSSKLSTTPVKVFT